MSFLSSSFLSVSDRVRLQALRCVRYLLHRGGHHVHSPYVFHLLTRVVEEKTPYYSFDRLASETKELRESADYRGIRRRKVLELIFRLTIFSKAKRAICISTGDSVLPKYLSAARPEIELLAEDGDRLITDSKQADPLLLVVERDAPLSASIRQCLSGSLPDGSMAVLYCPRRRGEVFRLWQELDKNPAARVSIDTGELLIVIFHRGLNKRSYKAFL
ncbi:hypothetical protein [Porphyromonas gulae]|uniref:hypothetical protein n=1 Tax=Porphyromonas gulae TaxID=111105 RepID=UPI00051D8E38|nr:hypothetical protein [Porphyromonas gulae]KGL50471.1 hypothetical protein HQ49_01180 [Porphyromonas gulae]